MLGTVKKIGTDLTLKVKGLFASSESQVYVKDLRKVMMHDRRKCQYPKNYDQIVKSGKITEDKDSDGNTIYKLFYGERDKDGSQPVFKLIKITEAEGRSYFTIDFLVSQKESKGVGYYDGYYKPFGFSKIDLEKRIPVFEAQKTKNPQYPFELTNSSVLTKEVKNKEGKVQEVVDEKGRNGELLYTSGYKKLSTHFSEIRDQNGSLERDKSLISVPIVFVASLAKVCAKLPTSPLMKLGEKLIGKENLIAKSLGYLLFTPAMVVKNLVNIGATILKSPILLFVANKKKYGDAYLTMWKHQLSGCWEEAKNDFSVIEDEKRSELEKKDYPPCDEIGTWKELDAMKPDIERKLEEKLEKSSENIIDRSKEPDVGKNFKKNLQNEFNKEIIGFGSQKSDKTHVERVEETRSKSKAACRH